MIDFKKKQAELEQLQNKVKIMEARMESQPELLVKQR